MRFSFSLFRRCTLAGASLAALSFTTFTASDAHAAVGDITYNNGVVNTHPQIMMVYLGNWDQSPKSLEYQNTIEEFLSNIGGTPYFNTLTGYYDKNGDHIVNQKIKIVGRLYDPDTTNPAIWQDVNPWIDPYVAQQPANTVFFIVPSADITQTWCGSKATGCNGMTTDGVHDEIVAQAFDSAGNFRIDYSRVWFHELGEVITGGDINGWKIQAPKGLDQIGDVCDYSDSPWALPGSTTVHLGNHDFQVNGFPVLAANYNSLGPGGMHKCSVSYGPAKPPVTSNAIALTGAPGWSSIPTATYLGHWVTSNVILSDFGGFSSAAGVERLMGDFNGDGRTDIALTGAPSLTSVPFALAIGGGAYWPTNHADSLFAFWSSRTGVKRLVGDFNGDGKSDIALTGSPGWTTIPVGFSNGDGSLTSTNVVTSNFPSWASTPGVQPLVGDFDGDGKSDIALTGTPSWASVPVALSHGDGTFGIVNASNPNLAFWSGSADVVRLTGDFNGDGLTDFALTGNSTWTTIPVAFAVGNGTWNATDTVVTSFGSWSATPGVVHLAGDFDGDGKTDIALVGHAGWSTIPMAFSNGDGSWRIKNEPVHGIPSWSSKAGVTPIVGDFNGDGRADIALTGNSTWSTVPLAFSNGDGTWDVTNNVVTDFPTWASTAGAQALGAHE